MTPEQFLHRCPTIWHVGPAGAWDGIRRLGFRTADQLIAAADIEDSLRSQLRVEPRRTSIEMRVEGRTVTLRDQAPLFKRKDFASLMGDGMTVGDWIEILNRRVYLFSDRAAMEKILTKYVNLEGAQDVITFSPRTLLEVCRHRIELSAQKTGAIARVAGIQKRRDTFLSVGQFPDKRPAEITVLDGLTVEELGVVAFAERVHADGSRTKLER